MNEQFFRRLFPSLSDFLARTFHRSWVIDYPDARAAVLGFATRCGPKVTKSVLGELQRLRETRIDDDNLSRLLHRAGCEYEYELDGETARGWLLKIEDWMQFAGRSRASDDQNA